MNNSSRIIRNAKDIPNVVNKVRYAEHLESIKVILIGVGEDTYVKTYLDDLTRDANIDQYIWVGDATPNSLAKMADFISKSVSSASQSLGTGGPSQNLTF